MDIRGFTIPVNSIYFIDFEATRILPSGPGTGVKIYDYEQKPAAAPHPPEGMGAVDPYAFDVFKVGCALQWFLEVSIFVPGPETTLIFFRSSMRTEALLRRPHTFLAASHTSRKLFNIRTLKTVRLSSEYAEGSPSYGYG